MSRMRQRPRKGARRPRSTARRRVQCTNAYVAHFLKIVGKDPALFISIRADPADVDKYFSIRTVVRDNSIGILDACSGLP